MQAIVDGRKYDTTTAEKIVSWDNGEHDPMKEYEETLYKTARGNFFVLKAGGAQSPAAVSLPGNARGMGAKIVPIAQFQLGDWMRENEENLTIEASEKLAKYAHLDIIEA